MKFYPILKYRTAEIGIIEKYPQLFNNKVIPILELVKHSKTNNVWSLLFEINLLLNEKTIFIDFLRGTPVEYECLKNDPVKADLMKENSDNEESYLQCLELLMDFPQFIPIISIKNNFLMQKSDLCKIIDIYINNKKIFAIRITDNYIEEYKNEISLLNEKDYLFIDINEQKPNSKVIFFEEIEKYRFLCKIIIIESSRIKNITNSIYESGNYTDLINTDLINYIPKYNFHGFGNYCGCKNAINSTKVVGKGYAIVFLYDLFKNKFFVIKNEDSSLAAKGYECVKKQMFNLRNQLDKDLSCLGFNFIKNDNKIFYWNKWIQVCIIRYLDQINKYLIENEKSS